MAFNLLAGLGTVGKAIGSGVKKAGAGLKTLAQDGEDDGGMPVLQDNPKPRPVLKTPFRNPLAPKIDTSADAPPPPGTVMPDVVANAQSQAATLPKREAPIDVNKELGQAPINKLDALPALPTRTPLDKSQKTGVKNRLLGAWEGLQNAGMHGASGEQVIGAMIGGAANRENPNRQLWEQRELLPAVQKQNAQRAEILKEQQQYDKSAEGIRKRNVDADARLENERRAAEWAANLKQKAVEQQAAQNAKAAEAENTRKAAAERERARNAHALEMRKRFEDYDSRKRTEEFQRGLKKLQVEEASKRRLAEFQHQNQLDRDFYRLEAEAGDTSEPSDADIQGRIDQDKQLGITTTPGQAKAALTKGKGGKPGSRRAADMLGKRLNQANGWNSVPAGK